MRVAPIFRRRSWDEAQATFLELRLTRARTSIGIVPLESKRKHTATSWFMLRNALRSARGLWLINVKTVLRFFCYWKKRSKDWKGPVLISHWYHYTSSTLRETRWGVSCILIIKTPPRLTPQDEFPWATLCEPYKVFTKVLALAQTRRRAKAKTTAISINCGSKSKTLKARPQLGCWDCNFENIPCNLVDPASSHTLVSRIKPCMSQYKCFTAKLRMAH